MKCFYFLRTLFCFKMHHCHCSALVHLVVGQVVIVDVSAAGDEVGVHRLVLLPVSDGLKVNH